MEDLYMCLRENKDNIRKISVVNYRDVIFNVNMEKLDVRRELGDERLVLREVNKDISIKIYDVDVNNWDINDEGNILIFLKDGYVYVLEVD